MRADRALLALPSAKMNFLLALCFTEVVGVFLRVAGSAEMLDLMISLPAFLFMVYITLALSNAQKARKNTDIRDINSVGDLVTQCERALALIGDFLARKAADYRTYLALAQLAAAIRMFISRYERYLEPEGVWAALQAEHLVMKAELSGTGRIRAYIGPIGMHIETIRKSVISANDPVLTALREAP